MTLGGHARQTPDKGIHSGIAWTFADAAARVAFTPTAGVPTTSGDLDDPRDLGKFAWQLDNNSVWFLTGIAPETWELLGGVDGNAIHVNVAGEINGLTTAAPDAADVFFFEDASDSFNKKKNTLGSIAALATPALHASTHSDGGTDEITVENLATGSSTTTNVLKPDGVGGLVMADLVVADLPDHASTHENGGPDEISINGLSGLAADAQTPLAHGATHQQGGGDDLSVEDLAAASSNTYDRLRPDGSGGLEWLAADDLVNSSTGNSTTSGTTFLTKVSIVIPAEDATFIIRAVALVSHSNTTGNPSARLRNTTDAVTLGRDWNNEMSDTDNVVALVLEWEYAQTVVAGAKTIALQYALASGTGTMTISNAIITARRVIS